MRFTSPGAGCGPTAQDVTPLLTPGATYTVCVSKVVHLPYADRGVLAYAVPADIRVIGRYALSVDRFRAPA